MAMISLAIARPWPIMLFFAPIVLKCIAVCLLCFYFVTYCAQIMHKIIIIERHTTTILMVCYTEASNLD